MGLYKKRSKGRFQSNPRAMITSLNQASVLTNPNTPKGSI